MKQNTQTKNAESTKELVKDIFSPDSFFEHVTQITKAHAYDILAEQVKELKAANKELIDISSTVLAIMALERMERYDIAERLKTALLNSQKVNL